VMELPKAQSKGEHLEAVIETFQRWETDYPENGEPLEQAIAARFRGWVGPCICRDDSELSAAIGAYFAEERHRCRLDPTCAKVCAVKLDGRRGSTPGITCPLFPGA